MLILFMGIIPNLSGINSNINTVSAVDITSANSTAQAPSYKIGDNELRGVWIASVNNVNFPSKPGLSVDQQKAELDNIVKTCKEANLNAIFFQVRPESDALYNSGIFPVSKYLAGKQGAWLIGGFDPLKYIIQIAHANGIELHAWVNPYRITNGTADNPQQDLNALSPNNPARMHPDWVVKYADGRMYYNPGLPQVQQLVTDGVTEIVKKYDVDGIVFDDYFYPYPVNQTTADGKTAQATFDDSAAYKKYGSAYATVGDFRRASVNGLVKGVYTAIKKANPNVRFGISPFGIWQNKSAANPTGSATAGLEAYSSIYCDATAWVQGGYVDYICPEIYWAFGNKAASYDVLVRWWSALVDGTGVDLYIGHAAYKLTTDFKSELEIPRQVEYARDYMGVKGSVFYGYKDIAANSYNVKDNLAKLFAQPRPEPKLVSTGSGVIIGRPANGSTFMESSVNIMGGSDPAYPVYYNNQKVTRTKSGFFSVYVSLNAGKNNLVFTENGVNTTHVINQGKTSTVSKPYVYPQMSSYKIDIISPTNDIITVPGDKIQVRVQAPSKSTVTAKLGGATVTLTALTDPPDEGKYMTEVYSGTITLPATQPSGHMIDLGGIVFTATRNKETASATGINVKLINNTAYTPCEVVNDYAYIKIAPDSSFYDDYLPASVGMRDNIVGFKDGYYHLSFGGYVAASDVVLKPDMKLAVNKISSASMANNGKTTDIKFGVTENVPVDAKCKDGVFNITLYNTPDGGGTLDIIDNPIFKSVSVSQNKDRQSVTYSFNLIDADNFYGFEVVYDNGSIFIKVKNPMKVIGGDKPLNGLTIIVDAGHGGNDPGALGFLGTKGKNEKDLNLEIALAVQTELTALGANVVMIRDTDVTVDIYSRMDTLNKVDPDLCISIHHNSLGDTTDNSLTRGLLGLYCNDSGRLLAKSVSDSISTELNRVERKVQYQMLAMLRNHKFPAALIEMSFITNPDEYETACAPVTIQRSADGIANGVIAWIDNQAKFVK
ncbi:MAG: family 10 glycosylhydrolase [Oscillospiraceae bacterium]|nr:family 10 glycosylhydrolase [Oscillospiraceae bacterium]